MHPFESSRIQSSPVRSTSRPPAFHSTLPTSCTEFIPFSIRLLYTGWILESPIHWFNLPYNIWARIMKVLIMTFPASFYVQIFSCAMYSQTLIYHCHRTVREISGQGRNEVRIVAAQYAPYILQSSCCVTTGYSLHLWEQLHSKHSCRQRNLFASVERSHRKCFPRIRKKENPCYNKIFLLHSLDHARNHSTRVHSKKGIRALRTVRFF